jgi:putative membrane protein
MAYLIIKSLHLIFVVTWFAALFYIFRLYVYHVENRDTPPFVKVVEVMERRLYYGIAWPSLVLATGMGLALIVMNPGLLLFKWLHLKFFLLAALFTYHFYSGHIRKEFARGHFKLTSKQCRMINEVPTLVLLVVVPLAILKPF